MGSKKVSVQIDRVAQYIIRRLRGYDANVLTASTYVSLLPTIWGIINKPTLNQQETNDIIHATLDHALKVSSKSACKSFTVEFIALLLLVRIFIVLIIFLLFKIHSWIQSRVIRENSRLEAIRR